MGKHRLIGIGGVRGIGGIRGVREIRSGIIGLLGILARLRGCWPGKKKPLSELQQAQCLIAAIDRGGVPLNPARINAIARALGLEVSIKAPVEETIQRLRAAIARSR